MKTLDQWLAHLEACHPDEIDLGLERSLRVAQALRLLPLDSPVITVAGTNGKGSTIAYMAEILIRAGFSVGVYTSPHFLRYNERVALDGRPVSDAQLCLAFAQIEQQRRQLGVALTYFEFGTLAALSLFKEARPDVVLLEVGLGGRLDAVNIVDPDVAVVTTVALDHQDWLGSDREQIGHEKAGIFRAGRPALYGELQMPASVQAHADRLGAPMHQLGTAFGASMNAGDRWSWRGRGLNGEPLMIADLPVPELPFDNAATAIQALKLLPLDISDHAIKEGVAAASLTGRCQRLQLQGRTVILDVAHNPHAAAHLAARLQAQPASVYGVVGMLQDKDVEQTLAALQSVVNHWYPVTLKGGRGSDADRLAQALLGLGVDESRIRPYGSVLAGFSKALENSVRGDTLLVCGSFYTVADVLSEYGEDE